MNHAMKWKPASRTWGTTYPPQREMNHAMKRKAASQTWGPLTRESSCNTCTNSRPELIIVSNVFLSSTTSVWLYINTELVHFIRHAQSIKEYANLWSFFLFLKDIVFMSFKIKEIKVQLSVIIIYLIKKAFNLVQKHLTWINISIIINKMFFIQKN